MTAMHRLRARASNQEGTALIIALMSMMLLTALGAALVMVSNTETMIANNYRNGQEALYAADAAVERVVEDLLLVPRWNDILSGTTKSSFIDGAWNSTKTVPGGGTVRLDLATTQLQAQTDASGNWGLNNPSWKLYAWGPLSNMLPNDQIDSPMYVAVWIADDPAETDDNALADTNGTLMLRAEAYGPAGTHKRIEVTVARTTNTEIERGQIAQRGQEELNQRARKSAVQTPGGSLTRMRLNAGSGGLVVQ
jgi:type IV pilus assembly PilX-like protein